MNEAKRARLYLVTEKITDVLSSNIDLIDLARENITNTKLYNILMETIRTNQDLCKTVQDYIKFEVKQNGEGEVDE